MLLVADVREGDDASGILEDVLVGEKLADAFLVLVLAVVGFLEEANVVAVVGIGAGRFVDDSRQRSIVIVLVVIVVLISTVGVSFAGVTLLTLSSAFLIALLI